MSDERDTAPKTESRSFDDLAGELRRQYSAQGNVRHSTVTELLGDPTRTVAIATIEPRTTLG